MITLETEVKRLLPQGSGEAGFLPPGPMITLPKIAEGQRGDKEWTLKKRCKKKKKKPFLPCQVKVFNGRRVYMHVFLQPASSSKAASLNLYWMATRLMESHEIVCHEITETKSKSSVCLKPWKPYGFILVFLV